MENVSAFSEYSLKSSAKNENQFGLKLSSRGNREGLSHQPKILQYCVTPGNLLSLERSFFFYFRRLSMYTHTQVSAWTLAFYKVYM
jgi:hypothetical protein